MKPEERARAARGYHCLLLACSVCLLLPHGAQAADSSEVWPEASLFVRLNPQTRLFFDAAYADGKESEHASLDLAAYLDVSLKPIRKNLQSEDWQRNRYLWARVGYDRIFNSTESSGAEVAENRGIVALYAKAFLPAGVVMEGRVRTDLRWIGDEYSTRYRVRAEFTREFIVHEHAVVPYFNVEWFYDTRYDGWSRTLYQLGPEVTVNKNFRYEIYLARQSDHLPKKSDLDALGMNFKWYY